MTIRKTCFITFALLMTAAPLASAYAQPIFDRAREDSERRAENKAVRDAENPPPAPTQTAQSAPAAPAAPADTAAPAPAAPAPAAAPAAAPAPAPAQ